ncbi:hypothetical protein AURDEDRAFT_131600, partial [Auricularia subglabra TFB-10046 SS5]
MPIWRKHNMDSVELHPTIYDPNMDATKARKTFLQDVRNAAIVAKPWFRIYEEELQSRPAGAPPPTPLPSLPVPAAAPSHEESSSDVDSDAGDAHGESPSDDGFAKSARERYGRTIKAELDQAVQAQLELDCPDPGDHRRRRLAIRARLLTQHWQALTADEQAPFVELASRPRPGRPLSKSSSIHKQLESIARALTAAPTTMVAFHVAQLDPAQNIVNFKSYEIVGGSTKSATTDWIVSDEQLFALSRSTPGGQNQTHEAGNGTADTEQQTPANPSTASPTPTTEHSGQQEHPEPEEPLEHPETPVPGSPQPPLSPGRHPGPTCDEEPLEH